MSIAHGSRDGIRSSLRRRAVPTRPTVARDPLDHTSRGFLVFAFGARRGTTARKEHTMERAEKEQVLGEIKEAFSNVASIIIADYRGIKVPSARRAATTAC
jgi:hypothetical protein